jgi:hypothetical protein
VSSPGATPSPWGEPAGVPPLTVHVPPATDRTTRRGGTPIPTASHRWVPATRPERVRAALTMVFVAIVLGAAAAAVLGIGVWALAAFFHHAASG